MLLLESSSRRRVQGLAPEGTRSRNTKKRIFTTIIVHPIPRRLTLKTQVPANTPWNIKVKHLVAGRGYSHIQTIYVCAAPKRARSFYALLVSKRVKTLLILRLHVWNLVWIWRELRECTNVFIVSIPNEWEKKEREICQFEMNCKKNFCFCSYVKNDDIIS